MIKTLILSGQTIVAAHQQGSVTLQSGVWSAAGGARYPATAGVTGIADVDVPAGFDVRAYTYDGAVLVPTGWTPPVPARALAHVSGWQACLCIIGVIGPARFATMYQDPALLLLRVRIDTCRDVDPADMPSVFALIASVDPTYITADESVAVMAAWPSA